MNAERLLALYDRVADVPDAVGRLRRFVLELAVRGRLVEQDPADEPVRELLAQARHRLRERGKSAKRVRWMETGPVAPDEIRMGTPHGWLPARVNDTGLYVNGLAFKPADWRRSGTPIIRIQNLTNPAKGFNFASGNFPDEVVVRTGDLLVSWSATLEAFRWERGEGVLNQHIFRVIPDDALTTREYLLLLLKNAIREMAESRHAHGLVMKHINRGPFLDHVVLIPPLAEQRRIVAKVDELTALCDRLEETRTAREDTRDRLTKASYARLSDTETDAPTFRSHTRFAIEALPALTASADQVKHLRQTILSLAVRGKLVEQDSTEEAASMLLKRVDSARRLAPTQGRKTKGAAIRSSLADTAFALPAGWARARLSQLVRVLNGRAYKKAELLDSGTPVLRVGNLFTSRHWYYSDLQLAKDKYCDKGDLLYAWSASFGPVIWQGPRVIFHYHIWKLSFFSEADLDKRFLYYLLLQQTQEIKSAGHGVAMVHMTKGKMERLPVPLPPLAEQHRIVATVDILMALCDRLEDHLGAADGTRNRLLESLLQDTLTPAAYEAATAGAVGA